MKLVIIDGIDNTGKTELIKMCLEKLNAYYVDSVAFPSRELAESDFFKNVAMHPTEENIEKWMDALLEEEYLAIIKKIKLGVEYLFVDRMWISTLVYQGKFKRDILTGEYVDLCLINERYESLMHHLGLYPDDVYHFICKYPMSFDSNKDTNEVKAFYDRKQDLMFKKLNLVLEECYNNVNSSDFFENTMVFDEYMLLISWFFKKKFASNVLCKIQEKRVEKIVKKIIG